MQLKLECVITVDIPLDTKDPDVAHDYAKGRAAIMACEAAAWCAMRGIMVIDIKHDADVPDYCRMLDELTAKEAQAC